MSQSIEESRVFVVGTKEESKGKALARTIENTISHCKFFFSKSANDVEFKLENTPAHVVVVDLDLPEVGAQTLITRLLANKKTAGLAFVILSPVPDNEFLVDEIVTGKLQFLHTPTSKEEAIRVINKALNYVSSGEHKEYGIKFCEKGELVIHDGEAADYVYILKSGKMEAFKEKDGEEIILGEIQAGEFVGEMAHFNHENRSANVRATEECELIVIPDETLDRVLFTKPSWTKALFLTLSKRVKETNEKLISEDSKPS